MIHPDYEKYAAYVSSVNSAAIPQLTTNITNTNMFNRLFTISQRPQNNAFPVFARNSKVMEEVGEFSEALLHKFGYLPHKTPKEPIEGEAADVILTIIDTLAAAYPELSAGELSEMLSAQIDKKSKKWVTVMNNRNGL
jgi:NTP pyrophosphatase (non-canonical NTP hydrolase)